MRRAFNTDDETTAANLSRLDHFASWTHFDGGYRGIDGWLVGVIGTIHMLPPAVQAIVTDWPYMIAGAHQHWAEPHLQERWKAMTDTLKADLDKLDARLAEAPPLDMAGRPVSRAERVHDLAAKLMDEGIETTTGMGLLRQLASNSTPSISSDIAELQRLAKLKRKPDDYRSRVFRCLGHMKACTWEMHFFKAI